MKIEFLRFAEDDLNEAVTFYNTQQEGLGDEFAEEVRATLSRIQTSPEAWQRLSGRTRRHLTHRFPYGVIYQIRQETLLVVAVMHLHRHPDTWKKRLE